MSRENVEVVRQLIEANCSDDVEASIEVLIALSDPTVDYTRLAAATGPEAYRSHEAFPRYFDDMADSWREWRTEAEEIAEVRPDTVVGTVRFRGIGKESGVPVEARLAVVAVLSKGKVLRAATYASREEALAAVGLRE